MSRVVIPPTPIPDFELKSAPVSSSLGEFEEISSRDMRAPSKILALPAAPSARSMGPRRRTLRKKRGTKKGPMAVSGRTPSLPPALEVSPTYFARLRFQCSTGATFTLTEANFAGAIGVVTTAANTTHPISSAWKIKRVTIWPSTQSTTVQNQWAWDLASTGHDKDSLRVTTVPFGITSALPLTTTPPSKSLAAFWTNSNVSGTFAICTIQTGSVVDLEIDFTLSTGLPQFAAISTTAAGTVGNLYYLSLDGTGGKLNVVGRPTII